MTLSHISAGADSFSSLWKQVETAQQKDLPKTVVELLDKIALKAEAERAYGHLLKAQIYGMQVRSEVAPDSLKGDVERFRQKAEGEKNAAVKAVMCSALGTIYRNNPSLSDEADTLSRHYYALSLADPKMLASQKSSGYEPTLVGGADSKIFGGDLLHVLGMEAENYQLLHDYYEKAGNRQAACLTALSLIRKQRDDLGSEMRKSKYVQSLDSLIAQYKDIAECGEVAIERYNFMDSSDDATAEEKVQFINYALINWGSWPRMNILRNAQSQLTLPNFHARIDNQVVRPDVPTKLEVMSITNIQTLTLNVYPMNANGDIQCNVSNADEYAKVKHLVGKTPVFTDSRQYIGLPAYKQSNDSIEIKGLPVGVYLAELTTDNNAIAPERLLLYVSDVYVYGEPLPNNKVKFVCVNSTSGQPINGATIRLSRRLNHNGVNESVTLTTDQNGEATYSYSGKEYNMLYAFTPTDKALQESIFSRWCSFNNRRQSTITVDLFTDRAIYRPGQQVHVAALCKETDGDEKSKAIADRTLVLILRDANYKEVARQEVVTDEFGIASADFTLPSSGLTGRFHIRDNKTGDACYFNVEEYKRPTFTVDFDKVTTSYQDGDTVSVRGVAKSYAGVPVQGAKVAVKVERRQARWCWWIPNRGGTTTILTDTLQTDSEGAFTVKVPMLMPDRWDGKTPRYYSFDVSADVTDVSGESHHGQTSLPLSDKPTAFSLSVPDKMLRDSIPDISFSLMNNAGQPVEGDVRFSVDGGKEYSVKSNTPFALKSLGLKSGRHTIEAVCAEDTVKTSFIVFSLDDKRPAVETDEWFYQSASEFPTDGKPVYIQFGSSDKDQYIEYIIFSGKNIIEEGRIRQSDALTTRALKYKPEYGEGILATYAWVKNGKLHHHSFSIEKPLPDKRIEAEWVTFRDRLEPGQDETWTLRLTRPDGTPARSQLLAVLYDKSLDQIMPHSWHFNLGLYRVMPSTSWRSQSALVNNTAFAYGEQRIKFLNEPALLYTHLDPSILPDGGVLLDSYLYGSTCGIRIRGMGMQRKLSVTGAVAKNDMVFAEAAPMAEAMMMSADEDAVLEKVVVTGSVQAAQKEQPAEESVAESVQVRENLNETAFFYPTLTTDGKGEVNISFTLPESITTWRFMGFAHDSQMNNGMVTAETVAKKKVMIQPNMPRFLRHGDKAVVSAKVINTSEEALSGNAVIELIDPETEKVVYTQRRSFSVDADKTVAVSFDIPTAQLPEMMICRVKAVGNGYSDGEQHYLPMLPSAEMVTNTMGFTQNGPGTKTIDLTKLIDVNDASTKLTVEYTNNPTWLMVQALPSVATPNSNNAISLASAYYSNAIADNILHQSPEIKKVIEQWQQESGSETSLMSNLQKNEELKAVVLNETPWVMDATREADQKRQLINYFDEVAVNYRLNDQLSKLKQLQLGDGSFTWWPGMRGNIFVTTVVTQTLIRLNHMTGDNQKTEQMIAAAMKYMGTKAAEDVARMKKEISKGNKNPYPSEMSLDYLYCLAISGMEAKGISKSDIAFIEKQLSQKATDLTIYGKARSAIILSKSDYKMRAAEYLESLRQYTVYTEEMGRYFDTPRAHYSWRDYRIPSQVAAIEAVKMLTPADNKTLEEMQRWLLQEKRTQAWDTPVNSVDAVYAFLNGETSKLATDPSKASVLSVDGRQLTMPQATAGLGYVKTAIAGKDCRTFTAEKSSEGTSWGAVYAQFMQPSKDVKSSASGIAVTREIIPSDRSKKQLAVGDRVKVRITITADRDYDFVEVIDKRAACLEPIGQISGYHWGYYCTPRDNSTNYYFDCLAKGKHVVETEYYIDREGEYESGTCVAQCAYSPEYSGRDSGSVIKVSGAEE